MKIKLINYLNIFSLLLFITGILPFLISGIEFLNYKNRFNEFINREEKEIMEFISGIKRCLPYYIEFVISYSKELKFIYKKEEIILEPDIKNLINRKEKVFIYKNKFYFNNPEYKFLVRYEKIVPFYPELKNSILKTFFSFLFSFTFILLLILTHRVLRGLILWTEEKGKTISDFLSEILDYRFLREFKEKEEKKKFLEIAEIITLLSHEIKNSLQSLLTYMKLIKIEDKIYKNIYKELNELQEILIDYEEYFVKGKEPAFEEVYISEIIEEALNDINMEGKIKVEKEIEDFKITGNRLLLKKAIINIIKNSIEAIENEGIIKIKVKKNRIIIEDTGEGMDKEVLKRATEPFFTTKSRGLGLGLSFVKKITELHKYKLKIESEKGKGTKVIIEI
ncbi:MAG: ATP-binding protein [candidate division WOR-3 bacterium]